ncbi:Clavaminate synthase-like protein [Nemania sp. FL0031]|nr:Clavaminate synthase-like protein [Nemania sp. FL0031]
MSYCVENRKLTICRIYLSCLQTYIQEEPADVNSEKPIIKIHPRQRPRIWQTDFSNPTGRVIGYAHQKDMHPRGEPFIVERSWLRNACACDICVDASSGQKRFAPSEVPSELPVSGLSITKEGSLKVFWENDFFTHDTHMSTYPLSIWQGTPPPLKTWVPKPWGMSALRKVSPYYSYESFITGEGEKFRRGMISLHLYGIIFLYDVPSSEGAVEEIASKIGTIQETFYGRTWDVKSKPEAENVAYTNSFLGLHQDLLYLSNVPRIQLLHCLENTCTGGESLFSDSYWAIQRLFRKHPEYIRVLRKRPVVYHYNKGDHVYRQSRPVLGDTGLWWSPPFQNPVQPDSLTHYGMEDYRLWHKATRVLQAMLEMENCVYELKMTPGVCVIFDNRRVTHGRRSFDTGSGKRWLKGTYVENDSYCSKIPPGLLEDLAS